MNTHYWRTRFTNEFGIHFSASELRFALAFIEEEIEKAVASYQTEYEQKHIASAVEIARKEEREKNDIVLRKTSGNGGWLCYSQKNNTKPKFGATPEKALQAHLTT